MLGCTVKEDYTISKIITLIIRNLFSVHLKSTSEHIRLNFLLNLIRTDHDVGLTKQCSSTDGGEKVLIQQFAAVV